MHNRLSIGVVLIAIAVGGCAQFVGKSVEPFESGVPGYSVEALAPGKFRVAYFSHTSSSDASAQRQFANFAKSLCPAGYNSDEVDEVLTIGTSHDPPIVGLGFRGVLVCHSASNNSFKPNPLRGSA